jgi:hypothetical protein
MEYGGFQRQAAVAAFTFSWVFGRFQAPPQHLILMTNVAAFREAFLT